MRGQTSGGMARRLARQTQTDAKAPEPVAGAGGKAILLLSGGLDSCTAGAAVKAEGYELHAVSFDYGQRHKKELAAAKQVGEALGVKSHRILKVPLGELGGSALTDAAIAVPDAPKGKIGAQIPSTYVPARNAVFLSLALAVAEVEGARAIVIGANALDYSGYPDCRPEFLAAFERMANLATKASVAEERTVRVLAPLLHLSKRDIVLLAARLDAPIALTWSCYRGGAAPCGSCESCVLRAEGFAAAGLPDPAVA